jgi:hypothetical protein
MILARRDSFLHKLISPVLYIGPIIIFTIGAYYTLFKKVATLPPPEGKCAISVNWNGIVPGKSTRQEVINALGQPQKWGLERVQDVTYFYFTYQVARGMVADYVQDRIYFRPGGIVDWMEIVVADRDGSYHSINEGVELYGNVLDVVYINNNYDPRNKFQVDVLGGPDQLYVWSDCGVVLDTLPRCSSEMLNGTLGSVPNNDLSGKDLVFRFPNPYHVGGDPDPDVNNMVLMEILFPPTTYKAFTNSYMYKIPYGLWDDFVRELSC